MQAVAKLALSLAAVLGAQPAPPSVPAGPTVGPTEKLVYDVEWRLIHAGTTTVESRANWARVKMVSAGLVSSLFKVDDTYAVNYDGSYCATVSTMDSQEGKRRRSATVQYDRAQNQAFFTERDLVKDAVIKNEHVEIPSCVHDIVGALLTLRRVAIEPGTTIELPVSDGRKFAQVKIKAEAREDVVTKAGRFRTVRFEAQLMNDVVYRRKGRVYIWISDDAKRLPVQMRVRMSFPVGSVTLSLEKETVE